MGKYPVISCDFKVRVSSLQTFQTTRLRVAGISGGMLLHFEDLVFVLYAEWEDCLMQSFKLPERTYFESIHKTSYGA